MDHLIKVIEFQQKYQEDAATLINLGLGEHFGFVKESMNPDLYDIAQSYSRGVFMLALVRENLAGTGAIQPLGDRTGQICRMHTAKEHRRHGIASIILRKLEQRATSMSMNKLILETNIDWKDAIAFYQHNGYQELSRNHEGIRFQKIPGENS